MLRRSAKATAALGLAVGLSIAAGPAGASEMSCWDHNGSLVRLVETPTSFEITYVRPREVLRRAGVRSGTLLIDGRSTDGGMSGTARRFSRHCPDNPMRYPVSGYFPTRSTLVFEGRYEVADQCRPTGRVRNDVLRFSFAGTRC